MKDILHLNMYLITNLLTVYTVYKFFKIFFDEERYQKYKIAVYLLYYITTTSVYLFCHNSLLTLVANIICMFVITNLYKSSLSKKMYCGCFSIWCFNASRMHCCFDWYFFKMG